MYARAVGAPLKRMFLHAWKLRFAHPVTGEPVDITAPLPEELSAVISALESKKGRSMTQTQQIKTFHPKLVVFDWDGTILDTTAAIALSIQYACEKIGLPVPSNKSGEIRYRSRLAGCNPNRCPTCPEEDYSTFWGAFTLSAIDRLRLKSIFPGYC